MKIQSFAPLVTTALLMSAGAASAALTVNESFDYAVDPLSGANGGTGWAGAWGNAGGNSESTNGSKNVTAGSLAGDDAAGNKASLVGVADGSSLIYRSLSSTLDSGTVYVGFTFRRDLDSIRTSALSLYDGTSEKTLIGLFGTDDKIGVGKGVGLGQIEYSGISAVVGTTYQLVLRIDFDSSGSNDVMNLFVDQTTEGTADATVSILNLGGIDTIRLFAGGGGPTAEASFDEIRIGSDYADVLVIPEPSSLFLIGLTGIAALGHRRRK